jgi:hypothetical protein
MDGRASYCVYATNNGNSTIWLPSELLQYQYIFVLRVTCFIHVTYARRAYISLRRVDRTTRIHLQHCIVHIIVIYIFCTLLMYTNSYFIVYIEEILVEDIAKIYIKEVFIKYKVLIKI